MKQIWKNNFYFPKQFYTFEIIIFYMAAKTQTKKTIGEEIKEHFSRNQRWLAKQIGMSPSRLSEKINEFKPWKQEELDKINKVLNTNFKL